MITQDQISIITKTDFTPAYYYSDSREYSRAIFHGKDMKSVPALISNEYEHLPVVIAEYFDKAELLVNEQWKSYYHLGDNPKDRKGSIYATYLRYDIRVIKIETTNEHIIIYSKFK